MGIIWVVPFAGILLSIAIFPLVLPDFWHHNFGKISLFWASILIIPFVIKEGIGFRQVWKDVRIHPAYGTVEVRIADSMPSLIDTVAVATFVQALAIKIGNDWEEGSLDKPTPNWLIERNRWAAIKEGLNAKFIIDLEGRTKPIKEVIKHLTKEIS